MKKMDAITTCLEALSEETITQLFMFESSEPAVRSLSEFHKINYLKNIQSWRTNKILKIFKESASTGWKSKIHSMSLHISINRIMQP